MPRESSKCREWEKERRNRLNDGFGTLCKLLPCYNPAITTSKIDILRNASGYIKELQEKLKNLLEASTSEAVQNIREEEIKRLQERVRKLTGKNEQLCNLLKDAKISIPQGCMPIRKFKRPLYWSGRILPEQAKSFQKTENEKENNTCVKKVQQRKNSNKSKIKQNRCITNSSKFRKAINRTDTKKLKCSKKKNATKTSTSKCLIVLSQPNVSQNCYVITNAPSNHLFGHTSTVITNSILNPVVSSETKKPVASNLPQLGPGTLILANGTVVPLLPQIPAVPQIIPISPRPTNPIILLSKNIDQKITNNKSLLPKIKPKYCLTRTTQMNKVPIPALTSRYGNNDSVLNKISESKTVEAHPKSDNNNKTATKRKLGSNNDVNVKKAKHNDDATNRRNGQINCKDDEKVEKEIVDKSALVSNDQSVEEKLDETTGILEKIIKPCNLEQNKIVETDTDRTLIDNSSKSCENTTIIIEKSIDQDDKDGKTDDSISSISKDQGVTQEVKDIELNIGHSELSNDIFASLQVPSGCQNPESTSPTAAFLLAFPLVSSLTGVKVTEVTEEDNSESQRGTPTLLQIGTMDNTKPTQSESLTPSLLNLDNLSFFSSKDLGGFYTNFENSVVTSSISTVVTTTIAKTPNKIDGNNKKQSAQLSMVNSKITYDSQKNLENMCPNVGNINENFERQDHQHQQQNRSTNDINLNLNQTINYQKVRQQKHEAKATCVTYGQQKPFTNTNCNKFNSNNLTKICTCSYVTVTKTYSDPLYTNSNSYYSYSEPSFYQNNYKTITKNDGGRSYYSLNYENYSDYRKNDGGSNNFSGTTYYGNTAKFPNNSTKNNKSINNQSRLPINWMTTPDSRNDYVLPQFTTKENDFSNICPTNSSFTNSQTSSYFNSNNTTYSNSTIENDVRKLDLPLVPPVNTYTQRNEVEDNQFSWSPTKIPQFLDTSHSFVSSTLPTLVGDLALGSNPLSFGEQKERTSKDIRISNNNNNNNKDRRMKNYENQTNFLSVSQLVDHSKETPARTTARRNSGNRGKNTNNNNNNNVSIKSGKRKEIGNKNVVDNKGPMTKDIAYAGVQGGNEIFCDNSKNRVVPPLKNTSSNYSAEALIGHQNIIMQPDMMAKNRQQNYTTTTTNNKISVPPFLPENIIPYFPTVDLQQDNNYMQQNQNYQNFTHNFVTTFQNNTYTPNTFIPSSTTTSSYLSTPNNFMHDMGTGHDYAENLNLFPSKDRNYNKIHVKQQQCQNSTTPKKSSSSSSSLTKRKHSNETNLPNFVDFPFLSMPGSINSPILPDDFHNTHTNFLQPPTPQLYPCKNPLYSKQNELSGSLLPLPPVSVTRSSIQHPEISPSINNVGTTLTNFNLSTIFPEINKGALSDSYLEPRIKDNARNYTSSVQVPFNDKPSFNFSYNN